MKTKAGIHFGALILLQLKIFVFSMRYGVDIVIIEDKYNTTVDYNYNSFSDDRFTINTKGCIIPLVAGSDTLRRIYDNAPSSPLPCNKDKHPLITSNRTHIITLEDNFKFYYNANNTDIQCCYKAFYRPYSSSGITNNSVDDRIVYTKCIRFEGSLEVDDEFVKVDCNLNEKLIYSKVLLFAQGKKFTTHRFNPFPNNQSMYNILIMGLGSISRQNFYRTMPKTQNLLKDFEAVELKGYNAIAKDTLQNLVALLMGMNASELHNICYPNRFATLDSCPFIWERFKDIGFYTALAEDSTKRSMFNKKTFGFRGTPTDYYMHPFLSESERVIHRGNSECLGNKYYFEILLNYIDMLTTRLYNTKLFGLFWETSMSYNHLKYPNKMDAAYASLIEKLSVSGYLNKTILILFSDHGMNVGKINAMKQGRLEQRLPIIYIAAPRSFREKYPVAYRNLQLNKDRLTTPYDLHSTLVDLLDLSDISDGEIIKRSLEPYFDNRGISLFLKVPIDRNCESAGINKNMCSCYKSVNISVNNHLIPRAVMLLSNVINDQLKPYRRCLKLTIQKVLKVYELIPGYEENHEWRTFLVIFKTMPGGGVFEATFQHRSEMFDAYTIVTPVKRLNISLKNYCVKNAYIKMLCYCKQH